MTLQYFSNTAVKIDVNVKNLRVSTFLIVSFISTAIFFQIPS